MLFDRNAWTYMRQEIAVPQLSYNKVKGCERAASNPGFYGRTQVVTAGGGMRAAQMIAHANVA